MGNNQRDTAKLLTSFIAPSSLLMRLIAWGGYGSFCMYMLRRGPNQVHIEKEPLSLRVCVYGFQKKGRNNIH